MVAGKHNKHTRGYERTHNILQFRTYKLQHERTQHTSRVYINEIPAAIQSRTLPISGVALAATHSDTA